MNNDMSVNNLVITRLFQNSKMNDDYDYQFASTIFLIDPIDRLSQQSIDKLFLFINQISPVLDNKPNHIHILKFQGQ